MFELVTSESFRSPTKRRALAAMVLALGLLLGGCGEKTPEQLVELGKQHLTKREYNAAVIQLKNALQKQPENAETRFLLGDALSHTSDLAGSEAELRRALQYKFPEDRVIPALVRVQVESGQAKKAIDEFGAKVLATPQAEAELRTQIGLAQLQLRQNDAAAKSFASALKAQPGYPLARIADARLLMVRGDAAGADKAVDVLIAESPENIDALFLKAELAIAQSKFADAAKLLDKVVASSPRAGGAWFLLVLALAEEQKIDDAKRRLADFKKAVPRDVRVNYLEAVMAMRDRNLTAARDSSLTLLKSVPDHVPTLVMMGLIEYETNNFVQAEDYLKRALDRAPGHALAVQALVSTHLRNRQPARALERLEPFLRGNPNDPRLLALAGEAYLANNRIEEARKYFELAASAGKQDARTQLRLGQIYLASNDEDRALKALTNAAALDPSSDQPDLIVITNSLQRRDADKALASIDALEKKRPNNPLTYNLRGSALLLKKDLPGARAAFAKALEIEPTYYPAAANLAGLDMRDGKRADAMSRFEKILAKDPKSTRASITLAELMVRDGRPPKDVADVLERSLKDNRTAPEVHQALIAHHLRTNNPKQAVAAAQTAVAALPDSLPLLEQLGFAQQAVGEGNQAVATFNKLAAAQPGSALPWIRAAGAYASVKDYAGAVRALRKALELDPANLDASRDLAAAYVLQGTPDAAVREARAVQTKQPKSAIGYALEGDVYASQRKWTEADQAYAKGQAVQPLPGVVVRRLVAMESAGQASAVEAIASAWFKFEPKDTVVRSFLAERALQKQDFKAALVHYQVASASQPSNVLLLNNLAWVSGKTGDSKAL
ncbi:MAG: XrtA/PEP-CTERM system TPR-repeat protein PrsT, partial [Burkholderiales bacterium]